MYNKYFAYLNSSLERLSVCLYVLCTCVFSCPSPAQPVSMSKKIKAESSCKLKTILASDMGRAFTWENLDPIDACDSVAVWPDWAIFLIFWSNFQSQGQQLFFRNHHFTQSLDNLSFYWRNPFWATFIEIWRLFAGHTACEGYIDSTCALKRTNDLKTFRF